MGVRVFKGTYIHDTGHAEALALIAGSSKILYGCEPVSYTHLGIDVKDTYAFGDSANDVDMLEFAGVGVAMGDGTDVAKEHADYVTRGLHEDGIYHALKHFALI